MIIGVDVGGTFTDIVSVDASGKVVIGKVPSIPQDEGQAVLNGLSSLNVPASELERLVHGTTVGTNAIIQRQGSRIAFVTTYGFRDVLEIGRAKRMIPGTMFRPFFVRPKPVVPRSRCFEIKERIQFDGQVLYPVEVDDVAEVCERLREADVEAVAICFLHSYANPANEEDAARLISETLGDIPISLSCHVVPEYREFERYSTTVLNAYIQPLLRKYLNGLQDTLAASGYRSGVLTIASSGGIMTMDTAVKFPVHSILSGPAGGIVQSVFMARQLGFENIITYDMGGTSTDVCLVRSYNPVISTDNLVDGFPLKIPQIDINTVGAGGGSIAWVDVDDSLLVGPQSAGADPGPAAYGRGGSDPTVTDANLLLKRSNPRKPLGGSISLMPELSERAFEPLLQRYPQLDLQQLAEGVIRLAVARMSGAIREISVQRGHDPREFILISYGGAGPMHAAQVAEELGIRKVLVPRFPGNLSAMGLVNCDLKHDYVRTRLSLFSQLKSEEIATDLGELQRQATEQLAGEGIAPESMIFIPTLDIRYWGQAFELSVPVDGVKPGRDRIVADFHELHQKTYGHSDPGADIELVNCRLAAYGVVQKSELSSVEGTATSLDDAENERRQAYFEGRFHDCPVYERDRLPVPATFSGPAIVEEFGATTIVPPSWRAAVDTYGNIIMERSD